MTPFVGAFCVFKKFLFGNYVFETVSFVHKAKCLFVCFCISDFLGRNAVNFFERSPEGI